MHLVWSPCVPYPHFYSGFYILSRMTNTSERQTLQQDLSSQASLVGPANSASMFNMGSGMCKYDQVDQVAGRNVESTDWNLGGDRDVAGARIQAIIHELSASLQ